MTDVLTIAVRIVGVCDDQEVSSDTDSPQIGPLDVDASALLGEGGTLLALLDRLGVQLEHGPGADIPADGWRVLHRQDSGAVTIGAPASASPQTWRIAHIGADQNGALVSTTSIHPEAFPVRRSRAERAGGLSLRWAQLSQDEAEDGVFVIDIVNVGAARWRPDGDPFVVVGVVSRAGGAPGVASFGYVSGQSPAVPLDPGEYARVHVTISESQWAPLEPGRHELHAMLAMLPVRSAEPLRFDLTQQQVDQRRSRLRSCARTPADEGEAHRRNYRRQKALVESANRLEEIAQVITGATSTDEATAAVALILHGDEDAARGIVQTPLMQFTSDAIQRMRANVLRIDQELWSVDSD
ncbi:hypothetical protein [Microbacterium sp. H1-D42]|uniref:hypothetical protein n=1 Tax=Microbacterium sp. H1-D42 TaxID=2925844 RepID=UPI001F52D912|nr:hypothetical protein [Microbacterium sp. H1-D42]UNK70306.1 hypothetical protein MNR00_14225 [Microbacterium sp. H1-D42]